MAVDPFGWAGQVLDGRYRAIEVAGDGGFGVVYRGHHLALDVPVAIKCLKVPQSLGPEERASFEQRFLEEGRVLHRLSRASAGVVQALDVGAATSPEGAWTPYLVLEWLEGQSLEDKLAARCRAGQARFGVAEAVALLGPAARALGEAHAQRIAHRDIKPANLFLSRVGERRVLKVLDFGIAKVLHDTMSTTTALRATSATGPGAAVFTPQYGAPEQFDRRKGATGPWTDVHALALVLVEMLIGARALEGDDIVQLMSAALDRDTRPTPGAHGVDVGAALERVLARALALRPEDRFASAGDFWDAVVDACPEASLEVPGEAASLPAAVPSAVESDSSTDTGEFLAQLEAAASASRAESEPRVEHAPTIAAESGGGSAVAGPRRTAQSPASVSGAAVAGPPSSERSGRQRRSAALWRAAALALLAVVAVVLVVRLGRQDPGPRTTAESLDARQPGPSAPAPATADALPTAPAGSGAVAAPAGSEEPAPSASGSTAPSAATAKVLPVPPSSSGVPVVATASAAPPAPTASAELLAPADYCVASCRVDGECTATLIGKVVVCRAASDAECKGSYSCAVHGQCWARDGYCLALSADDCARSLGCKQTGECSLRKGKCLQELITDCTKYPVCKSAGLCTARDNACYATNDAMCRASQVCADHGRCRSDGKQCVP